MPSIQPTPSNDYLIDSATALDPATLNLIFASIASRLEAQEALVVDYQAAIDTLNTLGLQVIAENLGPQLVLAQDQLNELQQQAELINDYLAPLLNGVIASSSVSVATITGLTATNVQAAIAEIVPRIASLEALTTSIGTALGTKQTKLTWSKKTASFNAVAGNTYLLKHTAALTVTFPAAPAEGDRIGLVIEDEAETYTVTVVLSGKSFMGSTSNILVRRGGTLILEFFDGAWRLAA